LCVSSRFFLRIRRPPISTLFPYTTLFRSVRVRAGVRVRGVLSGSGAAGPGGSAGPARLGRLGGAGRGAAGGRCGRGGVAGGDQALPEHRVMSAVIEASALRKEFTVRVRTGRLRRTRRTVTGVDGIGLVVERGELLGYIGPNGAGKSTTLKMMTGILTPSGGSVRVCGLAPVPQRRRLARRIGVVFGQRSLLWWDLPLRESFDLLRHIYQVPAGDHAARLRRCRQRLELDEFLDVPVRQLSLGQRMRGEITAAL